MNEEEHECVMCFKKISYKEWATYDMMCEEYFMDLYIYVYTLVYLMFS